ncbi:MAG: hypothetical protein HRT44_07560 [Bdellovibrionales bacterium]|nr:hypothetical protein [Bdellovibrionales bacterium]NQZ19094.1 hypothetical protein [Bdellovibrionales bacterium]
MKSLIVLIAIFFVHTVQASSESSPINAFGHNIVVKGHSVDELDLKASIMGSSRCASMFYGFGVLDSIEVVSIGLNNNCEDTDDFSCAVELIARYQTYCALELPDFSNK